MRRDTCAGCAMPVVSQMVRPRTPSSAKRSDQRSTSACGTSPSIGQPKQVDSDTLTGHATVGQADDLAQAGEALVARHAQVGQVVRLRVDITRFSSSARDSSARSAPRTLGTSTVVLDAGHAADAAHHLFGVAQHRDRLGDVKEVTSILA
jgi:hypothetical protein